MAGPRYHLKSPDGVPIGELDEEEVCRQIDQGALMLDCLAAVEPDTHYVPITHYPVFAVAFESRYGLGQPGHTSDSTPVSHSALLEALQRDSELVSPISTTRPALEGLEESAPATLKNVVGLLDEATPRSLPAEPATPVVQRGIPDATTQADARSGLSTDPGLPPVAPALPTLGDAPDGEHGLSPLPMPTPDPAAPTVPAVRISNPNATEPPLEIRVEARYEPKAAPATTSAAPPLLEVSIGIGTWAVLFLALTVASRFGLGADEARLMPGSLLYWGRVLGLFGTTVGLYALFPRVRRPSRSDLAVSPTWWGAALVVGLLAGLSFPGIGPSSPLPVALVLAVLVAIAEEAFFRGFLGQVLESSFPRPAVSVGLAAALYGIYCATLPAVWVDHAPMSILLRLALLTVGAGVPLALLQHWTRSLLPSLLCHMALAVGLVLGTRWRLG